MGKGTDEYFESRPETKFLVQNLYANMEALAPELDTESKEMLMRSNLIMIRQCLESLGVR